MMPSATVATLRPLHSVLGFDIIEFWTPSSDSGVLTCLHYFHSDAVKVVVRKIFPDSAPFHPSVSETWKRNSLRLCELARFDEGRGCLWNSVDHRQLVLPVDEQRKSAGLDDVSLPVVTEVVYPIVNDENDTVSYIICYTRAKIEISAVKVKFLGSIAAAAVIASTNFHDYSKNDAELDGKKYNPRPISNAYGSGLRLDEDTNTQYSEDMSVEMGCWSDDGERHIADNGTEESYEMGIPPTWAPADVYNFPVALIPPALEIPDNLRFDNFTDLKHIADGSNSNVYTGKFRGQGVIIKIITEKQKTNKIAVHEFDVEHGMLARFNHPNIVKLIGAGRHPRRFIVLEHLSGGSLTTVLGSNEQSGIAKKFFKKSTFNWSTLLKMAKDIADAFNYLHATLHNDCMIIHRDLKPDNIGFTEDGTVKLFDFGLCTCVKRTTSSTDTYEMTGNTGSLRYMAGEVALRQPYNEKVDVYSYGILLWQMAKDKVPFKGMNRADFMNLVVKKGVRPKIDKTWPKDFSDLLEACWHVDFTQRPSFEMVSHSLTRQLLQVDPKLNRRASFQKSAGQTQSTWF